MTDSIETRIIQFQAFVATPRGTEKKNFLTRVTTHSASSRSAEELLEGYIQSSRFLHVKEGFNEETDAVYLNLDTVQEISRIDFANPGQRW